MPPLEYLEETSPPLITAEGSGAMLSDWAALPSPVLIRSTMLTAPLELWPPRAQKKKMKVLPKFPPVFWDVEPNLGPSSVSAGGMLTGSPELSLRNPSSMLISTSSSSSSGSSMALLSAVRFVTIQLRVFNIQYDLVVSPQVSPH